MRIYKLLIMACFCAVTVHAQPNYSSSRQQEKLDRGLYAFNTNDNTTFVSWRYFQNEDGYRYQLLRNGQKMVETPKTHHTLPIESAATDKYQLNVVDANGNIVETTPEVAVCTTEALRIPLEKPASRTSGVTYSANDCSVGDIDGDGEYEIFMKWDPSNAQDNSKTGKTDDVYIDCYKLSGQRLWRICLGPNIRAGAHYTQFLVYDFDGDGKAELMCKTAPWSSDTNGKFVNQVADDATIRAYSNSTSYRNGSGQIKSGPEFLTVFNHKGEAVHTVWYNPNRAGNLNQEDEYPAESSFWGDNYANRSERYLAAVAYLDGQKPSAVFVRGYYTRAYFWAVDFDGSKIRHRWLHASVSENTVEHFDANWNKTTQTYNSNTSGKGSHFTAYGNGNHNLSVGDYDGDGKDEITFGSAAVDDDGQLMYSVGFGHGDAIHVGDLIPDRPGLEVFHVHEEKISGNNYGWDVHDARTGEVLWHAEGNEDNGRGIAADLIASNRGYEFSSSNDRNQRSATTGEVVSSKSSSVNFRVYWDGSLQDNLMDGGYQEAFSITKWGGSSFTSVTGLDGSSCNTTKRTPNLSADIFGDWREEVILHDDNNLLIYSSPLPTDYNVPCLMTDPIYRLGVAWQQTAYNQPPHLGYYLPDKAIDMSEANETIYYDPEELANQGVKHVEVGNGDITWTLGQGTTETPATITEEIGGFITESHVSVGSTLTIVGTKGAGDYTETQFQPAQKDGSANNDNAVTLTVTLQDGYEFIPTALSFVATRFGTDGGNIDVTWLNGDNTTKKIDSAIIPERNNATPPYSLKEYTLNNYKATNGTFGVQFNIYGLANNKQVGLANVIISGKVLSTESTGIREVKTMANGYQNTFYSLSGQRIAHPQKGVFIQNGQKFVVK